MTSEEAIPDFNSKDNISETDSRVTPTLENDFVSDENNLVQNSTETVYMKSVINRIPSQETTVESQGYSASQESGAKDNTSTDLVKDSVFHQTNLEDNYSTELGDDSISHQTNAEDNYSTELVDDSISHQTNPEDNTSTELGDDSISHQTNLEDNYSTELVDDSISHQTNLEDNYSTELVDDLVSHQTNLEDNYSTELVDDSVVHQTNPEDNYSTELVDDSVVHQTNPEDNYSTELVDDSVVYQQKPEKKSVVENGNSQPVEKKNENEVNLETTLLQPTANPKIQVEIKSEKERLVLILPTVSQVSISEYSWSEIWQQMKLRLLAQQRFFSSKINVHLLVHDRLLDSRQLQDIADTLSEMSLQLKSVGTSRRQTAIAAAGAGYSVEQLQPKTSFNFESTASTLPPAEPLYLQMTVRSGVEIRHRGSVIILGDVNPGGIVVASGDILIWGRLRGIAHAGAQGNTECTIMALQMEPTQLRIADALARAPEKSLTQQIAEVAYITTQGIRITKANDFSRISY